MYDVKEFHFNKDECWFRKNCSNYNTEECNCGCAIYCQVYYLMNLANIPPNMQQPDNQILNADKDLAEYEYLNEIKLDIVKWVLEGNNLYLYSQFYGNGKSTWAIKLMCAYFSQIWDKNGTQCRGLFINVDEYLMTKKNNISKKDARFIDMEDLITKVDLVVWDDIGCSKLKDYDHSILFPLINSRILQGKSNIFTSNVIDDELSNNIGGRLASRVLETSDIVEFINQPQRKPRRRGTNDPTTSY